ncbi:hypothetical protein BD779DRAFT_1601263 [Infundibulicybe gibba]|nr:hypothetical protein BD779DRAFT_1601263 [Infundibulicybe gibba]
MGLTTHLSGLRRCSSVCSHTPFIAAPSALLLVIVPVRPTVAVHHVNCLTIHHCAHIPIRHRILCYTARRYTFVPHRCRHTYILRRPPPCRDPHHLLRYLHTRLSTAVPTVPRGRAGKPARMRLEGPAMLV